MAIENVIDGNTLTCTYWSLDEFAEAAEKYLNDGPGAGTITSQSADWRGGTFEKCLDLARKGWGKHLDATLSIAEEAVTKCFTEHEVMAFQPQWEITGAEVDVARYLSGIPENMIDYPAVPTSKVGKVITLVAGGFYSCAVSAESLIKRGQVITALALALTQLGHATELWVDVATTGHSSNYESHTKVLVKGANDVIDPARILFAYAHPGMFRALGFAAAHNWPAKFRRALGIGTYYGSLAPTAKDFPEGTIYLEGLRSSHDVPDAHLELKRYLGELGLLAE